MLRSFFSLLSHSWANLVAAFGTTTLSVVLFSIAIPFLIFLIPILIKWREAGFAVNVIGKIVGEAFWPTAIAIAVTLSIWVIMYTRAVIKTVYEDHVVLVGQITRLQQEKQVLAAQLEAEKDKTSPKFEIEYAQPMLGGGEEVLNGVRTPMTTFFVQVTVYNKGYQSVIRGWKLKCKFLDGSELEGSPYLPDKAVQPFLNFKDPHGNPIRFNVSSSLFYQEAPIPTNGQAPGFVFFRFPAGLSAKMATPGTVFILSILDINKKEYKVQHTWNSEPFTGTMRMPLIE